MATPEKEKLEALMCQIKDLLNKHDVAAAIVLAVPLASNPDSFETVKSNHVNASFSVAETFSHHCCEQHGNVEGIAINVSIKHTDAEMKKKLLQTVCLFGALSRGVQHAGQMYERVAREMTARIKAAAEAPEAGKSFAGNMNMN